MLVIDGAAQI